MIGSMSLEGVISGIAENQPIQRYRDMATASSCESRSFRKGISRFFTELKGPFLLIAYFFFFFFFFFGGFRFLIFAESTVCFVREYVHKGAFSDADYFKVYYHV